MRTWLLIIEYVVSVGRYSGAMITRCTDCLKLINFLNFNPFLLILRWRSRSTNLMDMFIVAQSMSSWLKRVGLSATLVGSQWFLNLLSNQILCNLTMIGLLLVSNQLGSMYIHRVEISYEMCTPGYRFHMKNVPPGANFIWNMLHCTSGCKRYVPPLSNFPCMG